MLDMYEKLANDDFFIGFDFQLEARERGKERENSLSKQTLMSNSLTD